MRCDDLVSTLLEGYLRQTTCLAFLAWQPPAFEEIAVAEAAAVAAALEPLPAAAVLAAASIEHTFVRPDVDAD